jgi:hypothetical protein
VKFIFGGNYEAGSTAKKKNVITCKKMARNILMVVQTNSGGLNQSTGWNVSNKFLSPPL